MAVPATQELAQAEDRDLKALQQKSFESTQVADPQTLQEYINIAKVMAASGFYPDAKSAHQAVTLMILGRHFGLSCVQSLTAIHIVKGKPMLHYSAILAKVRQHPDYDYQILEHIESKAVIRFFRHGEPVGDSTFTIEDARRQGTQNLDKHAKTMMLARAASNGVKWYCPDVLNGMPVYVQGEMPTEHEHGETGLSRRESIKAELEAQKAETILAEAREVNGNGHEEEAEGLGI